MCSAVEAEIAATFENCKEAVGIRTTLQELEHSQPPTLIQVDNSTAYGSAIKSIKIKRTKAIDMRYHWVVYRTEQGQFSIHLKHGTENIADCHTKHHPPTCHRDMRSIILHNMERLKHNIKIPATKIACYLTLQLL